MPVATGQEINERSFQRFARSLDQDQVGIRSLQLAPGAVITYVYPHEGNEQIIGHDLLAAPERLTSSRAALP